MYVYNVYSIFTILILWQIGVENINFNYLVLDKVLNNRSSIINLNSLTKKK